MRIALKLLAILLIVITSAAAFAQDVREDGVMQSSLWRKANKTAEESNATNWPTLLPDTDSGTQIWPQFIPGLD